MSMLQNLWPTLYTDCPIIIETSIKYKHKRMFGVSKICSASPRYIELNIGLKLCLNLNLFIYLWISFEILWDYPNDDIYDRFTG